MRARTSIRLLSLGILIAVFLAAMAMAPRLIPRADGAAALGVMSFGSGRIAFIGNVNGIQIVDQPFTSNLFNWLLGAPPVFTVDSTGDAPDSNTGDGVCDDGTGACTLRAAIQQANQTPGADTINFGIGMGVQTISPLSALPSIDDPVTIDATTQPAFAGSPIIELNGAGAGPGVEGLTLAGGGSTVQGLVINRFTSTGVSITSAGNVVRGNFIGTDVSGAAALGNGGNAITIDAAADNTIGGTAPWERNVMSGNSGNGILMLGDSATGNVVEGNFIGTDATGTLDLGNAFAGVGILNSASHNTIGGTAPGAGNVVSGNGTIGVGMGAGGVCTDNVVQGNRIGTDVTGTLPIGNGLDGVGTSGLNNTVGGSTSEARNIIAFNGRNGVSVDAVFSNGTGNIVRGNSIFSNGALGIDLSVGMGPDGVTANDAGDGDTGANNLQNFPVLTSAVSGSTRVQGTLNSTPSTQYTLEFFHSGSCDPSGFGEGESFLGSTTVETDAGGNASFSVEFAESVPAGRFITATATDSAGNTSEFSQCQMVTAPPTPTPTLTPTPTKTATPTNTPVPPTPGPTATAVPSECHDLDGDGRVSGRDVAVVARALSSQPGQRRWNPSADVNHDGRVDLRDLFIVIRSLFRPECRSMR